MDLFHEGQFYTQIKIYNDDYADYADYANYANSDLVIITNGRR
jgi:hypothetical protein